jgi:leader peptidase (prepilin peptidase)/N-methyltransferase
MQYYDLILALVAGLAIGSFLNVLIYRLPRKIQFTKGRSVCPGCGGTIKWYHNIPLLSYIALRGRCSYCRMRIPIRYPLVELINALGWLYCYHTYSWSVDFGIYAFLTSSLVVIFFIDLEHQIIPDKITLPGMILGLLVALAPGGLTVVQAAIGLVVGGGSLYLVAILGDWLFKKESMGGGDIKMAAMLGAFLGWQKVLLIFLASAIIGLVISVILMSFSARLREKRVVPYGPFIALAAVVAIIWGDSLISYYVHNWLLAG